jgi:hypothetical protein
MDEAGLSLLCVTAETLAESDERNGSSSGKGKTMSKDESVDAASMHPIVHTPGPWRTARGFGSSPPIVMPILIVEGQGERYRQLAIIVPAGSESDEDLANAALMSRSPKMYDLLLEAENLLQGIASTQSKRLAKKIRTLIDDVRVV